MNRPLDGHEPCPAITPLARRFLARALLEEDPGRADVLETIRHCSIREINRLVAELGREHAVLRHQSYGLRTVIELLTDEVRRRAEELEIR